MVKTRKFGGILPRLLVLISVSLLVFQCAGGGWSDLPKQSPNASVVLYLVSNKNCQFFVDGQRMIKGNRVRILVTKGNHRVVCKPDGYRAKEEYIQPPFDPYHPIRFTFLIEDKLPK